MLPSSPTVASAADEADAAGAAVLFWCTYRILNSDNEGKSPSIAQV